MQIAKFSKCYIIWPMFFNAGKSHDADTADRHHSGELRDAYYSYPNYKEKIKKFGLIALEL